jgi:copper resistance protein D
LIDLIVYARAIHFAATIALTGVIFFVVFILEPAARSASGGGGGDSPARKALRAPLSLIAWISLAFALLSGVTWLVLTAASMSGQTVADAAAPDVLWTVLSQTDFGNAWLIRFALACAIAAVLVPLLGSRSARPAWLKTAAVILSAAFVGALAWAGHAIGGQGVEGVLHPAADVLHLIAAAAWLGTLVPLALLLGLAENDAAALATARAATLRFSTLGVITVGTLLCTGLVNTWYLVGSAPALTGTDYGRLLLVKIGLFLIMVTIASVNRLELTDRLIDDSNLAAVSDARRKLRRNAVVEASIGAAIIAIVSLLGVLPPASHSHHHVSESSLPADAAYQHIHGEQGMVDVIIEPGHVGKASATIRLWNDNVEPLDARELTLTLTAPTPGSKAKTYAAARDDDGNWRVDGVELTEPGNWAVAVDAVLASNTHLQLAAGIVIDAK